MKLSKGDKVYVGSCSDGERKCFEIIKAGPKWATGTREFSTVTIDCERMTVKGYGTPVLTEEKYSTLLLKRKALNALERISALVAKASSQEEIERLMLEVCNWEIQEPGK